MPLPLGNDQLHMLLGTRLPVDFLKSTRVLRQRHDVILVAMDQADWNRRLGQHRHPVDGVVCGELLFEFAGSELKRRGGTLESGIRAEIEHGINPRQPRDAVRVLGGPGGHPQSAPTAPQQARLSGKSPPLCQLFIEL